MADAWALDFAGGNRGFSIAGVARFEQKNTHVFVFDIDYDGGADQYLFVPVNGFNDSVRIFSNTSIELRVSSTTTTFTLTTPLSTGRQILKVRFDGSIATSGLSRISILDEQDNLLSPSQDIVASFQILGFGQGVSTRDFTGILYGAKVFSDLAETTLIHHWINITSGVATNYTDVVGGNNGVLTGFPSTIPWQLYDDGTGSADTILPTGVPTEEAFGTPAIDTNSVDVAPTSIPSETAFGTPSLTGAAVLTPSGIPSETSTGNPAITTGEVYIEPEAIPSLEAFGLPTVSVGVLFITPIGLASAEELGTPEIKLFVQYMTPTGIQTAEVLGRPSISGGDEPTFYLTNQGVKYKVNGAILISITNE